jgi:hypothetical protein
MKTIYIHNSINNTIQPLPLAHIQSIKDFGEGKGVYIYLVGHQHGHDVSLHNYIRSTHTISELVTKIENAVNV